MAYTLKEFCADHHALLTSGQPLAETLPRIAEKLSILLRNPEFVAESFSDDTPVGKRTLHHDPITDVYVLAHVNEGPKKGSPHSHGASWAVYGTARAVTEMTEWRRVNLKVRNRLCLSRWRTTASVPATPALTVRVCCTRRGIPRRRG